jgi:hypothetical protein
MIQINSILELNDKLAKGLPFVCLIDEDVYHASDPLSRSVVAEYENSPKHFIHRKNHPLPESKAFLAGRAVHAEVCEKALAERFTHRPEGINRTTKAGKAAYAEWLKTKGDRTEIDRDDYILAEQISEAIHFDPRLAVYFKGGYPELAAFAKDPETGIWMKAKADYWHPEPKLVIVDLKTIREKIKDYDRVILAHQYHIQAAWYVDVFQIAMDAEVKGFVHIVAEKYPPYGIKPKLLSNLWLETGRKQYRKWLKLHKECTENNHWPKYDTCLEVSEPPDWLVRNTEYD